MEMEDAKEALRIERAKMTREKKQWALDRKAEEKRWAEDMAQLSREKRMWAEEKERLNSPRVLHSERDKWDQERKSLLQQHQREIDELTERLSRAAEDAPSQPSAPPAAADGGDAAALERARAEWEQERQRLGSELADLSVALEAAKRDLKSAQVAKLEAEDQLAAAEHKAEDAERRLKLEQASGEARDVQLKELKGSKEQADALIAKAHKEALDKSQAQVLAAEARCRDMQAELDTARAELAAERANTREHKSAAETLKSIMDEELGETKAEREKWMQKKAILERAHIKDMMELKEQQAELRESDMVNFRALLKEEQEKRRTLEVAWTGLLAGVIPPPLMRSRAQRSRVPGMRSRFPRRTHGRGGSTTRLPTTGTHDAQLSYNTQRLSTGSTLLHVTCATVRQVGAGTPEKSAASSERARRRHSTLAFSHPYAAGSSAAATKPRTADSVSVYDRYSLPPPAPSLTPRCQKWTGQCTKGRGPLTVKLRRPGL